MTLLLTILLLHLCSSRVPACSAATVDTLSPSQSLSGDGKLVSGNGKFVLGFFRTGSEYSFHNVSNWYLGIWFNNITKQTPVWVANRHSPTKDPSSSRFAISQDGNLVIFSSHATSLSTIWSSQANITTNNTIAVLLNSGNLVLCRSSNVSDILWQSFDHQTDALLPGAKLGWDKITGQKRNLVSRKNRIDLGPGVYSMEITLAGVGQLIWNSSVVYLSSGQWTGHYFSSIPEMSTAPVLFNFTYVNNDQEVFFRYTLLDESVTVYYLIDVSGQRKVMIWQESNQDWVVAYPHPNDQCDVHAACGPFTACNSNTPQPCSCMKGFSIKSPDSWDLDDRTGGCKRNTPLDCSSNRSTANLADKFYEMPTNSFPYDPHNIGYVASASECELVCRRNCSCTAYSFGTSGNCSLWHGELLNVKQQYSDVGTGNGEILYLRLSAKEFQSRKRNKGVIIGGVIGACLTAVFILWALVLRYRNKMRHHKIDVVSGLVPFRYGDLQRATINFSEMIGQGGFGSVFKGLLNESTIIAVKRLNGSCQVEKQFRAELSSIGIIHHTNLVRMIGFCCEGDKKLLVFEYMPNGSLDTHLFRSNTNTLNWSTRYKIALGVAQGLAYLHESCRDCIIHCDIKPQNILLDESFIPKITDFGMAKLIGRNFSRVMTTMKGTYGYLAPEWISGMPITSKIDVYGYGMILLEIISGRRNSHRESNSGGDHIFYFPVEVARKLLEGDVFSLVDDKLNGDVVVKEVERVCRLACWCIQDNEFDRPTMGKVVQILEGFVELDVPPMPRLLQAIVESSGKQNQ